MSREQIFKNRIFNIINEYINYCVNEKCENKLEEQKSIIHKLGAKNAANCGHKQKYKEKINELNDEIKNLNKIIEKLQK